MKTLLFVLLAAMAAGQTTEPEFVDAVKTLRWSTATDLGMPSMEKDGQWGQPMFKAACLEAHLQYSAEKRACLKTYFNCADPKRVLLHSEDNSLHVCMSIVVVATEAKETK